MGLTRPECSNCRHCQLEGPDPDHPDLLWCEFWRQQVAEWDAEDCPAFQERR